MNIKRGERQLEAVKIYEKYSKGKQTLKQLSKLTEKPIKYLQRVINNIKPISGEITPVQKPLNIIFDATFWGSGKGLLLFRANQKNIYWREIYSETIASINYALQGLESICEGGFLSFTIDGRRGARQLLEKKYPQVPIQFCQFHQKMIIRRYNSDNPKTDCGKALKDLVNQITWIKFEEEFAIKLKVIQILHKHFLLERNENNKFRHHKIRSAFRSLNTNLPWLFSCKKHPHLNIPNTTNSCDGYFSHLKAKIAIHHGLKWHKKLSMIHFFLAQDSDSIS